MRSQPLRELGAQDYAAAIERDTLQGYEDFHPLANRVRALLAARREALTWLHTCRIGTPDAYWSYQSRYPRGPHADEALDNSRKYSLGLALAALLAPAFWGSSMPFEPNVSLDGLAALFCLVAILCLVTRFPWIGFLFLFLGIFTKETALPIVAAVIVYSLLARRISFVVVAVLMMFAWAGSRIIAFGQLAGVYAFNDVAISSWCFGCWRVRILFVI